MRIITILLLLFVIQQASWATDLVKNNYPSEGDQVPNFSFELNNEKTLLLSQYNNKIIYLVFFATWCPPCRKELPAIQKEIWEKFGENDQFKLLAIGREHTRLELDKFIGETHFTFPIVPDPTREIFSMFAPQEIPRSYLIDRNGRILKIMIGFNEDEFEEMKKMIEKGLIQNAKY